MGNTGGEGPEAAGGGSPPAGMSAALDRSLPTLGQSVRRRGIRDGLLRQMASRCALRASTVSSRTIPRSATTRSRGGLSQFVQKRRANQVRKPLFLIVSWINPHDIYGVLTAPPPEPRALAAARLPSNLVDDLRRKPFPQRHYLEEDQGKPFVGADRDMWRRYRAFYNRLVETVDREIGTVLDALKGGDVPPITVFTTDHGDLGGAHGLPYKGPAMYEELVRVPLVISWPGRIRASRSDALVSLIDLLPTLCDLTGTTVPEGVDGLSLRPILEKGVPAIRDMVFAEYYGKQSWRVPIRMIRTARWKYVRYLGHGEELYDLAADAGELRNLSNEAEFAADRTRLARQLDAWIHRTGDPFPRLTRTDRSGKVLAADPTR